MNEKKPYFVANAVLPNANLGTILGPSQPVSTVAWIKSIYETQGHTTS